MVKILEQFSVKQKNLIHKISDLLIKDGGEPYLVGGSVRDCLLGVTPKDIDIEVHNIDANKLESLLSKHFRLKAVGKSFGVFILKDYCIDVSMPRRESKLGPKHKDFKIKRDPNIDPKIAASRRDFTINSIYFNLRTKLIYDPFNGVTDLNNRVLKHTSEAFTEDPLRVLRAMQFIARFNLDIDIKTMELCKTLNPNHIPKERLFEEWKKLLLKGQKISKGLEFLENTNWLKYFPHLDKLDRCPQDTIWHPEGSVWKHTKLCMDFFAKNRINNDWEDLVVGLAVFCHDMGKSWYNYKIK